MSTDHADEYVFGPSRGGLFLHSSGVDTAARADWCACGQHRVEAGHLLCPACDGEAAQEATGGRQGRAQPFRGVRTPGAAR